MLQLLHKGRDYTSLSLRRQDNILAISWNCQDMYYIAN